MNNSFEIAKETSWCPGCGDHNILKSLKDVLNELELKPHQVAICSGIGQAAKLPHYINSNGFNGLHGRVLPAAAALKIVNSDLKVIINTGEGDAYGEGGNHFMHNIRRNIDMTHFVHNNQVYGLTKGQASPTSQLGMVTGVQTKGVLVEPLNPVSLAISLGASFVARSFSGDEKHLNFIMKEALNHRGYALVDILQPCISFNKINTFKYYKDRVYEIEVHDVSDKAAAFNLSLEWGDKIPIGIFYKEEKLTYHDRLKWLSKKESLVDKKLDPLKAGQFVKDFM